MVMSAAVGAIKYQEQLTGPQAECLATALDKNIYRLTTAFETQAEAQRVLPPELSNAIPLEENRLRAFKTKGKKRAMTGREAAEAQECDASRARRWKEIKATIVDNDEVEFPAPRPHHLSAPSTTSTSSDDDNESCPSLTSIIPSTMPEELEPPPPPLIATQSSGRVLRPSAKKADAEAAAKATATATATVTAPAAATVRRKDRRIR